MKRRNLFLSLISSVLVAIAIVTVTVCSVIKPVKKNSENGQGTGSEVSDVSDEKDYDYINEHERNGSKELPYVIYSADSFVNLLTKYNGKNEAVTLGVDKDGKAILDNYYFELVQDVDFSDYDYVTLFDNENRFTGRINGNGYSLKNISIDVTKANLEEQYAKKADFAEDTRYAHVGIFGDIEGAIITDLKVLGLNVNFSKEAYDFITEGQYVYAGGSIKEVVVGGFAGFAHNSTIEKLTVEGKVAGLGYATNVSEFYNAFGGVFGYVADTTINNSNFNMEIVANAGEDYFVGGVAGYAYDSAITNTNVAASISETYAMNLKTAGVFAYAQGVTLDNMQVDLTVSEQNADARDAYVASLVNAEVISSNAFYTTKDINGYELARVAGLICELDIIDNGSTISNVVVTNNVDFDCIFAGVILDVYSDEPANKELVKIADVIVDSNVNVLVAHGFARQLQSTTVSYNEEAVKAEGYYNVKISGSIKLGATDCYVVHDSEGNAKGQYHAFAIITNCDVANYTAPVANFFVVVSENVHYDYVTEQMCENLKAKTFGKYTKVA